jgi:hypothetical protein
MAKLVTVESGLIVPLPGTAEPYDRGIVITKEKTQLIIDGDDITLIFDGGGIDVLKNHRLELDEHSNYKERPLFKKDLFFINLRSKFADFRNFIWRHFSRYTCFFRRTFQTIFRKSHISNYDLMDLDYYLAGRILPVIKAFRKRYLERECREVPPLIFQQVFNSVSLVYSDEEISNGEKAWVAVMDEIIFAMRWCLEASVNGHSPKKIAFFKEYYGQYTAYEDDEDKYYKQISDAEKRAQKGFETFGKFFTSFWY